MDLTVTGMFTLSPCCFVHAGHTTQLNTDTLALVTTFSSEVIVRDRVGLTVPLLVACVRSLLFSWFVRYVSILFVRMAPFIMVDFIMMMND